MSEVESKRLPHILLKNNGSSEKFKSPGGGGGDDRWPTRNRVSHGNNLLGKVRALATNFEKATEAQLAFGLEDGFGLQIEFEGFADVELAFESLARENSGIELRNVKDEGDKTLATVFVPDGKLLHFEKLLFMGYLERGWNLI
jgi:hypothetical protein